jgi:hypothetical protein
MFKDDIGYQPTAKHLAFLRLTSAELKNCLLRKCPLGLTVQQFQFLKVSLKQALERDEVFEYDIRLKGSSVYFYSGYHKPMPWTRSELFPLFRKGHERIPLNHELDSIESCINTVWPSGQIRPQRRPFDSMFRIGVERTPSDYDIQICSDEIDARAKERVGSLKVTVDDSALTSKDYDFIQKDIIEDVCPNLKQWAVLQTDILQRLVNVVVFPRKGPPNKEKKIGMLSSHKRKTDWVIGRSEAE